ncbi:MAG: hypothetical protein J6X43_11905 [Bacteroidales bacterium]|nr:hypothetical protein [Bacteroidales bacterium]
MIYTIGETVIDLIFKKMQPQAAKVGGSALNTSVSLGRLGNEVTFISEIGSDELGEWCKSFLRENSVKTSYLIEYEDKKTSLALAFLNENNDAKYQFYKEFTTPMPEISVSFHSSDIVLFSSSFAINSRVRKSVSNILHNASSQHALLMYDPNMRKPLAKDSEAYSYVCENCCYADIVHISDEDAQAIFGTSDLNVVFSELRKLNVKVLVFTQNKNDVIVKTEKKTYSYAVPQITPVSTIGAGDTFNAGLLHCLSKKHITKNDLNSISSDFFDEAIPFAILCAGNVCQSIENYVDLQFAGNFIRK